MAPEWEATFWVPPHDRRIWSRIHLLVAYNLSTMRPKLITFDIFGTVLDWKKGMSISCDAVGRPLNSEEFEQILEVQGEMEADHFLTYSKITSKSLMRVLNMEESIADEISNNIGYWPLFSDASVIKELMEISLCAAMTNSDVIHGMQVQESLGFQLSDWLCAEESGFYKPDPKVWETMAVRQGIEFGPHWWHVSAYADFDLSVANGLGLTTVFVRRPHSRPGTATYEIESLLELQNLIMGPG